LEIHKAVHFSSQFINIQNLVKRLWYREVKYLAQGHTAKEPSLEPSPGLPTPEPVQRTLPYTVTGRGGQAEG